MALKVQPLSPPINDDKDRFVWPWVGVLANIPIKWKPKDRQFVGHGDSELMKELSQKGCNPLRVQTLRTRRGHSGFALVEFDRGSDGWLNAMRYDQCFRSSRCGNMDWNAAPINLRGDKLYGWIATEDDYKFEGIVGLNLRKCRDLKSISDITNPDFKSHQLMETQLQAKEGFSLFIDNLMKRKDDMIQSYNEEMRKSQRRALKHFGKLVCKREKTKLQLEAHRHELETRRKQLEEMRPSHGNELIEIQNEEYKCEMETIEQDKVDHKLLLLAEEHKIEKENLLKRVIELEKKVDENHILQLEMERMRGALRVMKYMRDGGDREVIQRMDFMQEQFKVKQKKLNEAVFGEEIQQLQSKPLVVAVKREYCEGESDGKASDLFSLWEDSFRDPCSQQVITGDGSSKEIYKDNAGKHFGNETGDEGCNNVVMNGLLEMNGYSNPNVAIDCVIPEMMNLKEERKAAVREDTTFSLNQWRILKKRRS